MTLFSRKKSISVQTIRRLPQYLRVLYDWHGYGRELASSTELAEETQRIITLQDGEITGERKGSDRPC